MATANILKHWRRVVNLIRNFFEPSMLTRNNIRIDENDQEVFLRNLELVRQYLEEECPETNYVFINTVDYIPLKRVDIDVLLLNNFRKCVTSLKMKGLNIIKRDDHSITLAIDQIQVDLHKSIPTVFISFTVSNKHVIEKFYGFNIFKPRLNMLIYLIDMIDKKRVNLGLLLNMVYALALIKSFDPMEFIKIYCLTYLQGLSNLPWDLPLVFKARVLYNVYVTLNNLKSSLLSWVKLKSLSTIISDLVFLLKP